MLVMKFRPKSHQWCQKIAGLISLSIFLTACGGGGGGSGGTTPPPSPPIKGANFTTFETGQVRPLAMSPDGNRLFATNTPNGTLEIYTISARGC